MNFNFYNIFFVTLTSSYILNKIYKNRQTLLINFLKLGISIKKKLDKINLLFNKPSTIFKPIHLYINGKYINYNKSINNDFDMVVKPIKYYTGIITFNILFKFKNKKYYFIRKNYLDNCLSDLKDFIEDIHKNYKKYEDISSNILNAELNYETNNGLVKKDITDFIKSIEGIKKDFNCECVYVNDVLNCIDLTINNEIINKEKLKIMIINNLADEINLNLHDKIIC